MDERMRAFERRAAGGDPEAEASMLRRRLASGDLSVKKLRFAALLGHPPAEWIYDQTPRIRPGHTLAKWVRAVRHFGGDEACARANLAAAERVLPLWEEIYDDGDARTTFLAGLRCLDEKTAASAQSARRAAGELDQVLRKRRPVRRRANNVKAARVATALRAGAAAVAAARDAANVIENGLGPFGSAVVMAGELVGQRAVRDAVRERLAPWALR